MMNGCGIPSWHLYPRPILHRRGPVWHLRANASVQAPEETQHRRWREQERSTKSKASFAAGMLKKLAKTSAMREVTVHDINAEGESCVFISFRADAEGEGAQRRLS